MRNLTIPAFIRGEFVTEPLIEFRGRDGEASFLAPDPMTIVERLPLRHGGLLRDLYQLSFDDILDYLEELGQRLRLDRNPYLRQALAESIPFSDMTAPLLKTAYETAHEVFNRARLREHAERTVGLDYLNGWVERPRLDGRKVAIRAFGARTLHVIAGNSPWVACITIIRCALSRSDAIIKLPSNDPLTALAVARTMQEMAPDHPITRHLAVAYWRGGTTEFEAKLYDPACIEKLLAWGGFASVKHVTRYIQPGLELISLDPKRSATIIGAEAFRDEKTLEEVAARTAADIGMLNQLACSNARVVYVLSGTDSAGLERANRLGEKIYAKMVNLPADISTPAKSFGQQLRSNLRALRMDDEWFRVVGDDDGRGAIIVSQMNEAVDWSPMLADRVANLVPVDSVDEAVRHMNSYTQTVGVYPESLKTKLRDLLALHGAQRIISLGYAITSSEAAPQDAIEPLRRMCRWITDDSCDPVVIRGAWQSAPDAPRATDPVAAL
jgi:hypothetical protein